MAITMGHPLCEVIIKGHKIQLFKGPLLSFSEDHRLPHISDELSSPRMDIVVLFKMRRPDSGDISSRGFIYYLFSISNSACVKGVAIGISSRLQPSVVQVTPVDERIMLHCWTWYSNAKG